MTTRTPEQGDLPILALLRDRAAEPRAIDAEAHANALLRAHALVQLSRMLAEEGLSALLVKGAALALTVYPTPASRPMGDVDLLVRPEDRDRIVAALERGGGRARVEAERPRSAEVLGETPVDLWLSAVSLLVEVHTTLDKIVPRPIDARGIFSRARGAPGLPNLLVPAPEDHAILIALHAAGHGFDHPPALLDLELLFRRGLDFDALVERAKAWRLATVMFVILDGLHALGAASIEARHVEAFAPGPARRALLRRLYRIAPRAQQEPQLGLPWLLRQTPLRDDPLAWARGLARYAALRGLERLGV